MYIFVIGIGITPKLSISQRDICPRFRSDLPKNEMKTEKIDHSYPEQTLHKKL